MPGCTYAHISKQYAIKHIDDRLSLLIKATFSCEFIYASLLIKEISWQSGVRSCIMTGLPGHLVQELNVSTLHMTTLNR